MMNMPKYMTVLMIYLLISCGNNKTQQTNPDVRKQDTFIIEEADLSKLNYSDFILDKTSKKEISGWLKYDELQKKINELKNADLSYYKSDKKVVETLIEEFTTSIPENIQTDAVNARVLVVQNMYYKLNSIINLSTSTKADIIESIANLLQAFSNLNFQINKEFERNSQNIIKP